MKVMDPFNNYSEKHFLEKKFFETFDSFGNICRSKYIREPLSEHDILDLQEKFLSNGIHYIAVDSVEFGRELVSRFIHSLKCYHENAVLSIWSDAANSISSCETTFVDIYCELIQNGYIENNRKLGFNEFFVDQFFYDFLFVEASEELIDSSWFLKFFSSIKNCEVDQHIPIFVVSYSK